MAFQGKILLIVALIFFMQKIRCAVDHTNGAHVFLTRSINNEDEALDQIDDDEGDAGTPATTTSAPSRQSTPENEAMRFLLEEYVELIGTEIVSKTIDKLLEKMKKTLTDKKAVQNIKEMRGEIYKYMTNPETPNKIRKLFDERYKFYVNEQTPAFIKNKCDIIKSIVNNQNIPGHIEFFKGSAVNFLTRPGDIKKRIAEKFLYITTVLNLPQIPFSNYH